MNNADAQKAEAEKERHMFQRKNEAFDQQRAELFQKALDEARSERDRIISTARKDSQEIRARRGPGDFRFRRIGGDALDVRRDVLRKHRIARIDPRDAARQAGESTCSGRRQAGYG